MTIPHDSSDAEAQGHHFRMIGTEYGDQSSPYWTFYESEAETEDRKFVEALKDDMTLMLIVNVLFSSIIATIIGATYQRKHLPTIVSILSGSLPWGAFYSDR
ncbi:hypothetical protein EDB89DRAFT_2072968 [Lactarius sanguifluus]|nr:hypothetical protein EDB89DRAFT_2072968 [Lactarius sanguifluus]